MARAKTRRAKQKTKLDPITLAVLHKRFDAVTTKMANTLLRTGRSGVLNLARDFSTSVVTRECELLTGAESLPIHHLSGADLMARSMMDLHPNLKRGDAYLHNSPYHGCSHPADHTILVPVIDAKGVHQFTVWVKAHQADCGCSQPTTYMGHARDVYEEGALIFPPTKVQGNYENNEDFINFCRMRIRVPEQWYGDYLAMIGAARIGEREVLAMGDEYGWETLHDFSKEWFDYSEKLMISAIKKLPTGEATTHSTHDPVPGTPDEGIPITAHVRIDNKKATIEVDLTDNPDAMPCGLNLSEACARTGAMIGVFNSIDDIVPTNAGSFRRVNVLIRDGSVAGGGKHPTSMSVATTNLADRVTNPVQRAFSKIQDGIGLAECGPIFPASMGVISGFDPRNDNEPFVNHLFLMVTGGAGRGQDGRLAHHFTRRQRRHVLRGQHRTGRTPFSHLHQDAQAHARYRGRGPDDRRALGLLRIRPRGRRRPGGRLRVGRRDKRFEGNARRAERGGLPEFSHARGRIFRGSARLRGHHPETRRERGFLLHGRGRLRPAARAARREGAKRRGGEVDHQGARLEGLRRRHR